MGQLTGFYIAKLSDQFFFYGKKASKISKKTYQTGKSQDTPGGLGLERTGKIN